MFRNVLDSNVKVFRLFCVLAFLPLFVILALSILLFMYDALQIFHKPILRDTTFSTDMRVQDAGIIKHYDFDSILLGSSMLKNTLNSQANDILGGKWVNLSMGASLFAERSIVLKYALTHKNIKHIIYSVDGTYIPHYDVNTNNFDFLYTSSDEIKKLRIYFNKKFITCAITWSKDTNCVGEKHSLDGVNTWIDDSKNKFYLLYGGIQNWYKYIGVIKSHGLRQDLIKISKGIEPFIMPKVDFAKLDSINMDLRFVSADIRGGGVTHSNNPKKDSRFYIPIIYPNNTLDSIAIDKDYLESNIINFVKENPHIRFSFIIPTYSRLFYYMVGAKYFLQLVLNYKWLIWELRECDNAKFYGFDDLDYADDIRNYMDTIHYNVDINALQLDSIFKSTHIINVQNMDAYFNKMQDSIQNYDIESIKRKIEPYKDEFLKKYEKD